MSLACESTNAACKPAHNRLSVKLVTGLDIPAAVVERASTLVAAGPFGRPLWWDSWWRHLRPKDSQLFLLTVWRGTEMVGLAPWYSRQASGGRREVRFLGDGLACSDYMTISAQPDYRALVWSAIAEWLIAEAGRSWDAIVLEGISAHDYEFSDFIELLRQSDIVVHQRHVSNTWRVLLPSTWEEYVARFSATHRNRLRKLERELLAGGIAMKTVAEADEFSEGFDIECRLHQLRRRSLGDTGCFANPRFESFLRESLARFLASGMLRLRWTELQKRPTAFDCCLIDQQGLFMYQTAFDPAFSQSSPGRRHLEASIYSAIESGYQFYDFLRGDEPYKAHFRATPIPVLETRLVGPRLGARLSHQLWQLQQGLKKYASLLLR